jgi:hypothetical protein
MFKTQLIMTNQVNFKKVEVKGYTKQKAVAQAPFQVIRDATQAWKAAGKPITDKALKEFCAEYLTKHTKMAAGVGCSITFEAGSADTRERPYTMIDIKNEKGKRKYKTGYQGINPATGEVLFINFETKTKAKEVAKELYTKKDYTGDVYCKYIKAVVEGEDGAFEVKYTPSKSAKMGTYICFGVEG